MITMIIEFAHLIKIFCYCINVNSCEASCIMNVLYTCRLSRRHEIHSINTFIIFYQKPFTYIGATVTLSINLMHDLHKNGYIDIANCSYNVLISIPCTMCTCALASFSTDMTPIDTDWELCQPVVTFFIYSEDKVFSFHCKS